MTVFEQYHAGWLLPEPGLVPVLTVPDKSAGDPVMSRDAFVRGKTQVPVRPASYLKKTFSLSQTGKATLYVAAHGIVCCYLNGVRLSDPLCPGPAEYDRRLPYAEYDASSALRIGENELLIVLVSGWWRGKMTNDGLINIYGNDVALLCVLQTEEGAVVSDESWLASQEGPVRFSDLMDGELCDARLEPSAWHAVTTYPFGYAALVPMSPAPIREKKRLKGKFIRTPKGALLLDLGQNIAGYLELDFTGEAGKRLVMTHGETLGSDGELTLENFQSPNNHVKQRVEYICREGRNHFVPSGSYFGFRYVGLEADFPLSEEMFTAVAVWSDMEDTARFRCGEPLVDQLFSNAVWSWHSNAVGVPTDCPTRQKEGFTGDLQVFLHTAMYLSDCKGFVENWLSDLAATQFDNGRIKQIAPDPRPCKVFDGGAGWCNAFEIAVNALWERYDDISVCERFYAPLKKWMDFLIREASASTREENKDNPYSQYLLDAGMHWGEWMEPGIDAATQLRNTALHGEPEIATAYLANGCKIMSDLCAALGKSEESAYYASVREGAVKAYRFSFLPEGEIVSDRMCRYVRPLAFGFLEGEEAARAAASLNALVMQHDYRPNTGFLTTHALLRVLTDHGYHETACRVLLQRGCPGWLYAVERGLTTIPERWDPYDEQGVPHESFNHYAYGSVAGWLFDSVLGIRLCRRTLTLVPHPSRLLGEAEGEYRSPFGNILSGWKIEGDAVSFRFCVPEGLPCTLQLPDGSKRALPAGDHRFSLPMKADGQAPGL